MNYEFMNARNKIIIKFVILDGTILISSIYNTIGNPFENKVL